MDTRNTAKRPKLTYKMRFAQVRHVLKRCGPLSLQDLTKRMRYKNHGALTELIGRYGLPPGVRRFTDNPKGCQGGGGNWARHMFELVDK